MMDAPPSRLPILLAALLAGGCTQRAPMMGRSPLDLDATLPPGKGGVIYTATPTPGPSPTPPIAATVVVEPPEPLQLAPGFKASVFADAVGPVGRLARAPNGDVFASLAREDKIVVLPDRNADGHVDRISVWWEGNGLNHPDGMAFWGDALWVANEDGLVRFPYRDGDLVAGGAPDSIVPLPAGGRVQGRPLAVNRQGQLFMGVGASCNACVQSDVRSASVLRIQADGSRTARYSTGFRAPSGIAIAPAGGDVWLTDRARDDLGDAFPPDEINRLAPGADYGWPFCVGDAKPDPQLGATDAICAASTAPVIAFPPHIGLMGAVFYDGKMFPADYRGGLFVAAHGSDVQIMLQAYKILFLPFVDGAPTGEVRDFAAGWMKPDTRLWGRPADVIVAPDGALLIADDAGNRVFRVIYSPIATATPPL